MMDGPEAQSRWPIFLRLAGTAAAVGLLVYWLSKQGWAEFSAAVGQIPLNVFFLAIAVVVFSRLWVVARWYALLRSADIDMGLATAAMLTFAGLFASNFLPTTIGGDIFRIAGVGQVPRRRTAYVTSVFADRIVGMIGMATALVGAIPPVLAYLRTRAGSQVPIAVAPMAVAASGRHSWLARVRGKLRTVIGSVLEALLMWWHRPLGLLSAFGATWLYMLCRFGSIWLILHSLGETISLGSIAGLWALTYFITLIPISIGGLGLQEVSMAFIFTTLGDVAAANILPTAVLVRAMDALVSLPGALFLPRVLAWRRAGPAAGTGEGGPPET